MNSLEAETPVESVAITTIEPDWETIRDRYLAGDELSDIAEATGVTANAISCRAYQQSWKAEALRTLCRDEKRIGEEIRLNLLVSVYRESRMLQRIGASRVASEANAWSQARERCISAAARLLRWDDDPVASAKPARCLDV